MNPEEVPARRIDFGDMRIDKRVDKRVLTLIDEATETTIKIEGLPANIPDVGVGETVHVRIFVPQLQLSDYTKSDTLEEV